MAYPGSYQGTVLGEGGLKPLELAQTLKGKEMEQEAKDKDQLRKDLDFSSYAGKLYQPDYPEFMEKVKELREYAATNPKALEHGTPEWLQLQEKIAGMKTYVGLSAQTADQYATTHKLYNSNPTKYLPGWESDFPQEPLTQRMAAGKMFGGLRPNVDVVQSFVEKLKKLPPKGTATAGPSGGYLYETQKKEYTPEDIRMLAESEYKDPYARAAIDRMYGGFEPFLEELMPQAKVIMESKNISAMPAASGLGPGEIQQGEDFWRLIAGLENKESAVPTGDDYNGSPILSHDEFKGHKAGVFAQDVNGEIKTAPRIIKNLQTTDDGQWIKIITNDPKVPQEWIPADRGYSILKEWETGPGGQFEKAGKAIEKIGRDKGIIDVESANIQQEPLRSQTREQEGRSVMVERVKSSLMDAVKNPNVAFAGTFVEDIDVPGKGVFSKPTIQVSARKAPDRLFKEEYRIFTIRSGGTDTSFAIAEKELPEFIKSLRKSGSAPASQPAAQTAKYTAAEEAGISSLMQKNPGATREQIIEALKSAGKLK